MNNDPNDLLEHEEKPVFLSDVSREQARRPIPWLMVAVIIIVITSLIWKTAVRQPDNRQAAIQAAVERNKKIERQLQEEKRKREEKYLKTLPEEYRNLQ